MQRVGGTMAHYACRLPADAIGVLAGLERRTLMLYRAWEPGLNSIEELGTQYDEC